MHVAAANNSNPDVVKALISAGAKVNAKEDKYGRTPLHKSPYQCSIKDNSNPDVVKALISAGAEVNAKEDKWPDSFACCSIQKLKPRCSKSLSAQVLRLMLKKIKMARLLCMYAAANNSNPDVVKALISAGAKVNAKD